MKKPFNDLLDTYYEERLKFFPLEATQIGDNRYNHLLPNDISQGFRTDIKNFYSKFHSELSTYHRDSLSEQEQVSYDIFKREMEVNLRSLEFNDHYMPVHQFWGMTLTIPQIGSGKSYQPFKTVKEYDNFLARIDGFAIWVDTAIVNMRKGLSMGYTFPKVLMERVLPQAKDMMVEDVKKSIFWEPIKNMPDAIPSPEKDRITQAYADAIKNKIVPSYEKLHDFLRDEYIPKTRTTAGFSDIPKGNEHYQHLINFWTTTNLSADDIFQIGQSEVTRIRQEMEKIKTAVGFKGNLKAFFEHVNSSKKFTPYKTPEDVIAGFNAIHKKMEPQLKKLFNMVPKTGFEVRQTEAFRAASSSAEYNPGTPDGSRPGIFYVPILNASTFNYTGMETLFLHEAIPGHHYQIALQYENEELPKFRRFLWYGAYGEGWALYTESLGKELGLYTDPYQYFGNLGDEIHRAIRLVVDVGLHAKGWTREQAIQYMKDNEAIDDQNATAEIERYMAIPAQALSYKIGQLKILELRKKAESALGNKFNLALFHDEVLKYGCLPLDVLENIVNRWIQKQQA
ncbi:DUF885 domain-containing protein [Chryseolinea sp. H1M3-3]|uniref:DUF885 domain-containing protein n=1 Tax=Chryseolinea sp. H1M3-3 TaxID=3034144 RepID=UPI0023ECC4D0|nr:DUF885 domain-containing protein [Chryseolinea sp. H1M3-3]